MLTFYIFLKRKPLRWMKQIYCLFIIYPRKRICQYYYQILTDSFDTYCTSCSLPSISSVYIPARCFEGFISCGNEDACYPPSGRCNGSQECPLRGRDELNCGCMLMLQFSLLLHLSLLSIEEPLVLSFIFFNLAS